VSGPLVIVGGGPAALSAARGYREAGGSGEVVMLCAEDLPPYRRPPLTKEYLRGEMGREGLPLEDEGWYRENGVRLLLSTRAAALDPARRTVRVAGGEEIPYESCVLATGAEPAQLSVPGADDPGIALMRRVPDADRLRGRTSPGSRVAVVGSGFIGCEAAASLALRGRRVTVVSMEELPQARRLGEEVGRRILSWLEGYGVEVLPGREVEEISRRSGGPYALRTGEGEEIPADAVLFGAGIQPSSGLAEEAGLRTEGGRIVTDSSMRASAPGVLAAGDVALAYNEAAGRPLAVEHWGDALEQGRIAGAAAAGRQVRWDSVPGFWSTIGEKTLKYWAWGDGWDALAFEEGDDGSFVARYGREGALVGVLAHGRDEVYEEASDRIRAGAPFPG